MKARSRALVVHVRPFFHRGSREACWLALRDSKWERRLGGVRALADLGCTREDAARAWYVAEAFRPDLEQVLQAGGVATCPVCAAGGVCAAWTDVPVFHAGFVARAPTDRRMPPDGSPPPEPPPPPPPVYPWDAAANPEVAAAAARLGLRGDYSRADVIAAHRRGVMRSHPDRGGATADMASLNVARDVLLKEMGP